MFGIGIIELLVIFLVFGGIVLALLGNFSARKWIIGGLLFMLFAGVVVALVGYQTTRRVQLTQAAVLEATAEAEIAYRAQLAAIHNTQSGKQPPAVTAPRPTNKPASPDWVINPPDNANLHVVASEQYASKIKARAEASNRAVNLVWKKVHQRWHPAGLGGYPNHAEIKRRAIRDRHTQKIIRTTEDNVFTVYRSYILVDTSPSVMASFEEIVEQETKAIRPIQVAIAGIVLTVFAGLITGFFRIDDRTKGHYRGKLLAGLLILGLLSVAFLPDLFWAWTDQSSRPIPPSPVYEGPADEVISMPPASTTPHRLISH